MDNPNKDGDSDSRELHGLKISDLLKALAEWKSPPCATTRTDPQNTSTTLSILKNTGTGTPYTHRSFRSRAVLPENIKQLSKCQFNRRDHLSESLSASVPDPASITASSKEEEQLQDSLKHSSPVIPAHLVEKSKMLPSDSIRCVGEGIAKEEVHPYIWGVQAWTKPQSCEAKSMLPQQLLQTAVVPGPTNEWFFEDLTDLQRKLFLGASKKYGIQRNSPTEGKTEGQPYLGSAFCCQAEEQ